MIVAAIENLLNRNLAASPRARELCRGLKGKSMSLVVTGTPWKLAVESVGDSLKLLSPVPETCQAEVSGRPVNLLAMLGGDPQEVIRRGDVRISGDAEVAQDFRELLSKLRPDVEEELSKLIGDNAAHRGMQLLGGMLGFGRRAASTTVQNVAEYLAHESGDLVPRAEADVFFRGVEQFRDDIARLEARLAALEAEQT